MVAKNTKIVGVFGYPIAHSLSPYMQNAAFKYKNLNYVYIPFEVNPSQIKSAVKILHSLGIAGMNLTIPHKVIVLPYLDYYSKEVRDIGAANTIKVIGKKIYGYNTDSYGFLKSLHHDGRFNPKDKNVLLLGAGGAARAVAYALVKSKVKRLVILNRTRSKAVSLARWVRKFGRYSKVETFSLDTKVLKRELPCMNLVINSTSVGLSKADPSLIPKNLIHKDLLIFDLIYNPPMTKLLKYAKEKRAKILNGEGMLVYQGAKSWEIWTGKRCPVDVMRKALCKALRNKT